MEKKIGQPKINNHIKINDLVVPKEGTTDKFNVGHVIGLSCLDLDIGPRLHIRDLETRKVSLTFPMYVDKLVREKNTEKK